jgi:hypothetical protein
MKRSCFILTLLLVAVIFGCAEETSEISLSKPKLIEGPYHENSVVVFIKDNLVVAHDREGNVISKAVAGTGDADVIQAAVDAVHPGGGIKILAGKYILSKPVSVYNSSTFSGEGRRTILVPPEDDFAIRVETKDSSPRRWYHSKAVHGVVLKEFAIDGKRGDGTNKGKGIYFAYVYDSVFKDLWIGNTGSGAGLFMEGWVGESSFHDIYLMANGNFEKKQAAVVIRSDNKSRDGINNLQIRGLFVIFSNYRAIDIYDDKPNDNAGPPRLIFISNSMFHGWLSERKPDAELIHLRNTDLTKGVYISHCRLAGAGAAKNLALLKAENSRATVSDSIIGGQGGIVGERGSVLKVTGNTFQAGLVTEQDGEKQTHAPGLADRYVLFLKESEAIFSNNEIYGEDMEIRLAPAANSIITNNRFESESVIDPIIWVGDDGKKGSSNIEISSNIFNTSANQSIKISPLSKKGIQVHHNLFKGD